MRIAKSVIARRAAEPSVSVPCVPATAASMASHVVSSPAGRGSPQRLDRLVADLPARHVDDPLEAHDVRVRAQDPQVRQGVLDLAPLVEPRPTDELVRDAVAQERFLDRPGLGVHPVHDRDVGRLELLGVVVGPPGEHRSAAHELLDPARDPLGLVVLVVGLVAPDEPPAGVRRPELLLGPCRVPGHDGMGRVEDELGAAIVLLELHDDGVRVVALEVEDVPDVGAAPAVDRLVVVADDRQVAVLRGERLDPQVLRAVRVLVLVDVQVAPAILVAGQDLGRLVEQADGGEEQVVEVERAGGREPVAVQAGQAGDRDPSTGDRDELVDLGRVDHLVLGPADAAEDRAGPGRALGLHALLVEDPLHQRALVVRVVDDEVAADADRLAVAAQDPRAQGVERARLDVPAGPLADERDDPVAQLPGGPNS